MKIFRISITKSKTVGVLSQTGKTNFKKIQLMAQADIEEGEDTNKAYQELSQYLESCFNYEKTIK